MRIIRNLNLGWRFSRTDTKDYVDTKMDSFEEVDIPHSWNAEEACEGDQFYTRAAYWYQYDLFKDSSWDSKKVFIEFEGSNSITEIYINGEKLGRNELGFSTFRYELTAHLKDGENLISVRVDNRDYEHIYPRSADFTFFGGIYRDVNLIIVDKTHFDLMDDGGPGVYVTPVYKDGKASIHVRSLIINPKDAQLKLEIFAGDRLLVTKEQAAEKEEAELEIKEARLWSPEDPYLYELRASLNKGGKILDQLQIPFGVRYFSMEGKKGFFLNGKQTYLKGVSRHQDRYKKAWAISKEDMEEDMEIIKEMGANSIRLAHYQHDQYFYDLCDENGMIVWAEVPFISVMEPGKKAHENIVEQLKRLVKQNYNHPSICFWGIANEITMRGESEELYDNLVEMDKVVKSLDKTRLTTIANVMMVNVNSEYNYIADTIAYNQYFGWYIGKVEDFEPWLESFHQANPDMSLGCSEYGAEGLVRYHTDNPVRGDYSEEYHSLYHEKVWGIFSKTPYLWGSYVWNMFDFSSKLRNEGGVKGMNNKGLVTYDRKIKKDAFYMYKAYWSDEKFVHITSRRFIKRNREKIDIKVYSNCDQVELFINGASVGKQNDKKIYIFEDVELKLGQNKVEAIGDGEYKDRVSFERTKNKENIYEFEGGKEMEYILSWFEDEEIAPEGYYSIKDNLGELMTNPKTAQILQRFFKELSKKMPMAEMMDGEPSEMTQMVSGISLETIFTIVKDQIPFEFFQNLNKELNKIKKEE